MSKLSQSVQKMIKIYQELDKAMTNIRIVTGMSSDDTKALIKDYTNLAKQLGTTTQ